MSTGSDLAAQVADLQAQVDALAQQVKGDTLSPNYLTINPDGTVSATFTGHIKASGVDLPEAPNTLVFSGANAVDWLDASTGQVREYITAGLQGTLHLLLMQSGPGLHGEKAELSAFHTDGGSAAVSATATDGLGHTASVRIIDPLGNSDLLQVKNFVIDSATFTGPAGGSHTFTAPLGIFLICGRAVGTNIDETIAYLWAVADPSAQSAFMPLTGVAYTGVGQVINYSFAGAINVTNGIGAGGFVPGNNANQMTASANNASLTQFQVSLIQLATFSA